MHILLDLQSWQNVNETPSPKHIKCTKSLPPPRTMLVEQQCNMVMVFLFYIRHQHFPGGGGIGKFNRKYVIRGVARIFGQGGPAQT